MKCTGKKKKHVGPFLAILCDLNLKERKNEIKASIAVLVFQFCLSTESKLPENS